MPVLTGQSLANSLPEISKLNGAAREYIEQVERKNIITEPEEISGPSTS